MQQTYMSSTLRNPEQQICRTGLTDKSHSTMHACLQLATFAYISLVRYLATPKACPHPMN